MSTENKFIRIAAIGSASWLVLVAAVKLMLETDWGIATGVSIVIVAVAIMYLIIDDLVDPITEQDRRSPYWRERWRQGFCPNCACDLRDVEADTYACPDCDWTGSRPAQFAPLNPALIGKSRDTQPTDNGRNGLPPSSFEQWG